MSKKWNDFDELPEQGQRVEVRFKDGIVIGVHDGYGVVFPNADLEVQTLYDNKNKWRAVPEESNEKILNDSKTIPNDLLLVWLAQKILEEYGTIAEDLETNVDKIILRYNAGKVTK